MTTIRISFYIAGFDGHLLDNAIAFFTGLGNWGTPPVSHTEVWWTDVGKLFASGECYTSTMRGKNNGTVIRPAHEVIQNPKRWLYFELCVPDDLYERAKLHARVAVENNCGYDRWTIASFFWFKRFGKSNQEICSEVAYSFLYDCGVFTTKGLCPSPRRLCQWLMNLGLKPVYMK